MSKTDRSQQLLNWLTSEKTKDNRELDNNKKRLIWEIKNIKKEDMFPQPKKITLWERIKILLLGS
jgi:hypothetical protein